VEDSQLIPEEVRVETEAKLDKIHDDANQFSLGDQTLHQFGPQSVGEFFHVNKMGKQTKEVNGFFLKHEFELWLREHKIGKESDESVDWRRQMLDWFVRWEECDAGGQNYKKKVNKKVNKYY